MVAGAEGSGGTWSQQRTRALWPQKVRARVQEEALLRGTRVSKTRCILEWPTMKMVREVVV